MNTERDKQLAYEMYLKRWYRHGASHHPAKLNIDQFVANNNRLVEVGRKLAEHMLFDSRPSALLEERKKLEKLLILNQNTRATTRKNSDAAAKGKRP
jgi:hypothetical protein